MYVNLTADGNSAVFYARDSVHVRATGTWGTGTLTLQWEDDQATPVWTAFPGTSSWTTDANALVDLPGAGVYKCRLNLAGASSPDLDITVR